MLLASAALRRFEAEGKKREDLPFLEWSLQEAFHRIQTAFDEIYAEIEVPGLRWLFRGPIALWSRMNRIGKHPSDRSGKLVAQAMQVRGEQRDRLTNGIYLPQNSDEALAKYEVALKKSEEAAPVYKKLYKASKSREITKAAPLSQLEEALSKRIITPEEAHAVRQTEAARLEAILVDEFTLEEYHQNFTGGERLGSNQKKAVS